MFLNILRPIIKVIPEVKLPERGLTVRERTIWTALVLICFFIMGTIYPVSVSPMSLPAGYQVMSMMFASEFGSIISLGIGPLVMAITILWLLLRFKILKFDLSKKEDRELFYGTQKILVMVLALIYAVLLTYGFGFSAEILEDGTIKFSTSLFLLTVLQFAFGAVILMYLDDIVVKWGIGSGIGLFIAARISKVIMVQMFNLLRDSSGRFYGILPAFWESLVTGTASWLSLFPILVTFMMFLIAIYAVLMKIEIPVNFRNDKKKFSLKFFYLSTLPASFVYTLLGDIFLWVRVLRIGDYYPTSNFLFFYINNGLNPVNMLSIFAIILVFVALCILFGIFAAWFYGINKNEVLTNLKSLGITDENAEKEIDSYVPHLILVSSLAIGLLAVSSDLLFVLATGTVTLITTGVLHRFYEEMKGHKKICPKCNSDHVEWLLPELWSLRECRRCGYRGVIVFEE